MTSTQAQFGMVGVAVMGRNLALNMADHGVSVAVWNLEPELSIRAVEESGGRLVRAESLAELCSKLERPRKLMLMVKAGKPVDLVLEQLRSQLEPGDIVIDGGNSWFEETRRREAELKAVGVRFIGMGVSGGEEGARHGPALMPGGDAEAYAEIAPIFEAIAAKTDSGACVTHCGADGAGHFVKMVHNGIEYADMQFIAEAYDILKRLGGLDPRELSEVFAEYNRGVLGSFLIEITAKVLAVEDPEGSGYLIDQVLDAAAQKGTGRWTAQIALELGVPIPSIAAAIDARVLSSMKPARVRAAAELSGPSPKAIEPSERAALVQDVEHALYAAKIGAYAQGMALIRAGAAKYGWSTRLREVARVWKGGCIIRARFLDTIMQAYEASPELENLLLAEQLKSDLGQRQTPWRQLVGRALAAGVPVPGMASSLAYFDSYRTADLPQNLTQAQRDAFGAHSYQRRGDPSGAAIHSEWLKP